MRASSEKTVIDAIETSLKNPELRPIVRRFLQGEISAHVTLLQLLTESDLESAAEAIETMERAAERSGGSSFSERIAELSLLYRDNRERCAAMARSLDEQVDFEPDGESDSARVAHYGQLFDSLVLESPEASVAAYSFGREDILAQSTSEIVDLLIGWNVIHRQRSVLQIGCGIGRFEAALAPMVGSATGIDISPRMIETARGRCASLNNVTLHVTTGLDLGSFSDGEFDLVYAVDSFPYVVGVGMDLAQTYFAEAGRVLRPRGDFVILNFSYRESVERDQIDVARLAEKNGFDVLVNGEAPFRLWNGAAFHLRKSGGTG
ncbi:MAG TPA: methyltransferase domain-containing protein [Thermoanaerobaculia bacterium]|nr:methyltransferase domain-containing protein [Thermoanaerobaculia bacterium]